MNGLNRLQVSLAVLVGVALTALAADPKTDEKAAEAQLTVARRSYLENKFPEAVRQYQELLNRYPGSKQVPAARFGLAQALLESAAPEFAGIRAHLLKLNADFPEYRFVQYYLGSCERGIGMQELIQSAAQPPKAEELQASARKHFTAADTYFTRAAAGFAERVKNETGDALSSDLEWSFRSRCDVAEMRIRMGKADEVKDTLAPLFKERRFDRSRSRGLALYYQGVSHYLRKDYLAAGRLLNQLSPFHEPIFGLHARYLLAQVHQHSEEQPEAALNFEAVLSDYTRMKKEAGDMLRSGRLNPLERSRVEAMLRQPTPAFIGTAAYHLGILQYQAGKFGDAQARFADFLKQFPRAPLALEAQLYLGVCQVRNTQFVEALKTLQPLAERGPGSLVARFWIGKAKAGAALAGPPPQRSQALKQAIDALQQVADKAREAADPKNPSLRAEVLDALADTQSQAGLYKDAAATNALLLQEKNLDGHEEELLQRQAGLLQLAGDYAASDQVCEQFVKKYSSSSLLPAVMFRAAENAAFQYADAEKKSTPDKDRLRDKTLERYQSLIKQYPDFPLTTYARYGQALIFYRGGDLEKAKPALEAIPGPDRTGELGPAAYLLADCLIRLAPAKADDALAVGRLEEALKNAVDLLDGFIAANPRSPLTPRALLMLGYCQQRWASFLVQPKEKAEAIARAKAAYDKLRNQFPTHELTPWALLGRSECRLLSGDPNRAAEELRRFINEPYRKTPAAPVAILEMARLLRAQRRSNDAVQVIATSLDLNEQSLLKSGDPRGLITKLRYHEGMALKESGKLPEARRVFEAILKRSPQKMDAALRLGQCLRDEELPALEKLRSQLAGELAPKDKAALVAKRAESAERLRKAAEYLLKQVELAPKEGHAESCARMLYEAAWIERVLGDIEHGATPPKDAARAKVRAIYQKLITAYPEQPLAMEARLEMAELSALSGNFKESLAQLDQLIEKEPSADLMEQVNILQGAGIAAGGDVKAARALFEGVYRNAKIPLAGVARLKCGEALMRAKDWAGAIEILTPFRNQEPLRKLPGVSDRGLFLLGESFTQAKQWGRSRDAFEQVSSRFDGGSYAAPARYGAGWTYLNQKQYDAAARSFERAAQGARPDLAAAAQIQAGICRLELKRYAEAAASFQAVQRTNLPEWTAFALIEAARAQALANHPDQAERLLRQVEKDFRATRAGEKIQVYLSALKEKRALPPLDPPAALKEPARLPPSSILAAYRVEKATAEEMVSFLEYAPAADKPERTGPAPALRLTLPDPFQYRRPLRLQPMPEETLPAFAVITKP